ncbi:MAG TPA: RNA polymerase sigma factor [Bacillus sp. (in: firmicutes)]|uniref:RNA polymerase sigma factor n=1 Tax=Bacillus litorisediminis TaxID=2922713 RepID=UPI001FAF8265|nr:RNA polymerase sigma factor [Bacillus litorisediminis]HWO77576.1 RNA polymerase sigma factor [Bacillus sp. (in: firmicutes)]
MSQKDLDIEEIYNLYYKDVYHFCIYYTNNKHEAEDITQETFIKAMRNINSLKSIEKAKVWILTIAKNTAIDYKRKMRRISFLPSFFKEEQSNAPSPEDRMVGQDSWEFIQKALLKLKSQYRSILILRGIKEYSTEETAEILGISEEKVRLNYHRAKTYLKREVGPLEEGWERINERKQ